MPGRDNRDNKQGRNEKRTQDPALPRSSGDPHTLTLPAAPPPILPPAPQQSPTIPLAPKVKITPNSIEDCYIKLLRAVNNANADVEANILEGGRIEDRNQITNEAVKNASFYIFSKSKELTDHSATILKRVFSDPNLASSFDAEIKKLCIFKLKALASGSKGLPEVRSEAANILAIIHTGKSLDEIHTGLNNSVGVGDYTPVLSDLLRIPLIPQVESIIIGQIFEDKEFKRRQAIDAVVSSPNPLSQDAVQKLCNAILNRGTPPNKARDILNVLNEDKKGEIIKVLIDRCSNRDSTTSGPTVLPEGRSEAANILAIIHTGKSLDEIETGLNNSVIVGNYTPFLNDLLRIPLIPQVESILIGQIFEDNEFKRRRAIDAVVSSRIPLSQDAVQKLCYAILNRGTPPNKARDILNVLNEDKKGEIIKVLIDEFSHTGSTDEVAQIALNKLIPTGRGIPIGTCEEELVKLIPRIHPTRARMLQKVDGFNALQLNVVTALSELSSNNSLQIEHLKVVFTLLKRLGDDPSSPQIENLARVVADPNDPIFSLKGITLRDSIQTRLVEQLGANAQTEDDKVNTIKAIERNDLKVAKSVDVLAKFAVVHSSAVSSNALGLLAKWDSISNGNYQNAQDSAIIKLGSRDPNVRNQAIDCLLKFGDPNASAKALLAQLKNNRENQAVVAALGKLLPDPEGVRATNHLRQAKLEGAFLMNELLSVEKNTFHEAYLIRALASADSFQVTEGLQPAVSRIVNKIENKFHQHALSRMRPPQFNHLTSRILDKKEKEGTRIGCAEAFELLAKSFNNKSELKEKKEAAQKLSVLMTHEKGELLSDLEGSESLTLKDCKVLEGIISGIKALGREGRYAMPAVFAATDDLTAENDAILSKITQLATTWVHDVDGQIKGEEFEELLGDQNFSIQFPNNTQRGCKIMGLQGLIEGDGPNSYGLTLLLASVANPLPNLSKLVPGVFNSSLGNKNDNNRRWRLLSKYKREEVVAEALKLFSDPPPKPPIRAGIYLGSLDTLQKNLSDKEGAKKSEVLDQLGYFLFDKINVANIPPEVKIKIIKIINDSQLHVTANPSRLIDSFDEAKDDEVKMELAYMLSKTLPKKHPHKGYCVSFLQSACEEPRLVEKAVKYLGEVAPLNREVLSMLLSEDYLKSGTLETREASSSALKAIMNREHEINSDLKTLLPLIIENLRENSADLNPSLLKLISLIISPPDNESSYPTSELQNIQATRSPNSLQGLTASACLFAAKHEMSTQLVRFENVLRDQVPANHNNLLFTLELIGMMGETSAGIESSSTQNEDIKNAIDHISDLVWQLIKDHKASPAFRMAAYSAIKTRLVRPVRHEGESWKEISQEERFKLFSRTAENGLTPGLRAAAIDAIERLDYDRAETIRLYCEVIRSTAVSTTVNLSLENNTTEAEISLLVSTVQKLRNLLGKEDPQYVQMFREALNNASPAARKRLYEMNNAQ